MTPEDVGGEKPKEGTIASHADVGRLDGVYLILLVILTKMYAPIPDKIKLPMTAI